MKTSIYMIAAVALAGTLGSCRLGKEYSRPALNMPAAYRTPQPTATGDTTRLPWKTFFSDPLLAGLIDSALHKNADMQIALKNLEQAQNNLKQARLDLLPQLNFITTASRNLPSKTSLNGSFTDQFTGTRYLDDYNTSLQLSWEADIWGRVANQKRAANAAYLSQAEVMKATQTRLIANVAQAYYNLLSLDEQLRIARSNARLSDSTVNILTVQYNSGVINSLALEQAKAQKKTAELLVPLTEQNIFVQENALQVLSGFFPQQVKRKGALDRNDVIVNFPAGLPIQLLSRRPDVRASELNLMASNAQVGISQAAMYPSFNISYQAGLNSLLAGQWFKIPASFFHTLTGNMTQVLLQNRRLKTAYQNALLEKDKNVITFRQTVITAAGEVNDALARVEKTKERFLLAQDRQSSLRKASKDAITLYNSGMANYLEVITAQNSLLQSELELTNIVTESLQANIELYRALGGGTI